VAAAKRGLTTALRKCDRQIDAQFGVAVKVLILFPLNPGLPFNTSAAALAGVARHHGFDCSALPIADEERVVSVLEKVLEMQPQVVCGTLMTRDILGFRSLFGLIKKHTNAFTAIGGYHATVRPRHVAQWNGVDAIGIGEGERPVLSMLRAVSDGLPVDTIPGLWVRSGDKFTDPIPPADPELDIADLPPWDYSILPDPTFKGEAGRHFLVTRTSRACPFACTYCTVPAWEATNGLRNRQFVNVRPVKHLCAELAQLRDRYTPTDIEFWDPQFPFATNYLEELAELFPSEVGLPFRVLMHVKTVNQERVDFLAKAGCTQLYFGLESGDAEFRKTVLNKACSDDEVLLTVSRVRNAGISPCAFVMWNLPGETREQAERTIELVDRAGFDRVRVNSYIPLPGTVLGDHATLEFPSRSVDTFEPLPEWRQDGDQKRCAMSDGDYEVIRAEFAKLQNRYAELGHIPGMPDDPQRRLRLADGRTEPDEECADTIPRINLDRLPADRLRRLSSLLGVDETGGARPTFRLRDGIAQPKSLTLILVGPDDIERRVVLQPRTTDAACYAHTEHCLISYEGNTFSTTLGEILDHIRSRIEQVPFEDL
jgi:radical SAM superfamily enzyme YgiQ (UPF0313 family)